MPPPSTTVSTSVKNSYIQVALTLEYIWIIGLYFILYKSPHERSVEEHNAFLVVNGIFITIITILIFFKYRLKQKDARIVLTIITFLIEGFYSTLCLFIYNSFATYFSVFFLTLLSSAYLNYTQTKVNNINLDDDEIVLKDIDIDDN